MAAIRYNINYHILLSSDTGCIAPPVDSIEKYLEQHRQISFICLTMPFNPSGEIYSEEALRRILHICKEYNITLLIDKCQWDEILQKSMVFSYSIERVVSEELAMKSVVIINSFSKIRSIPGARIGYIIGCNDIINYLEYLNTLTYWQASSICIFPIIMDLLIQLDIVHQTPQEQKKVRLAFRHLLLLSGLSKEYLSLFLTSMEGDAYLRYRRQLLDTLYSNQRIIRKNYELALEYAGQIGVQVTTLDGGFNFCIKNPNRFSTTETKFKNHLLEKYHLEVFSQMDFCSKDEERSGPFWFRVTAAQDEKLFRQEICNVFDLLA